MIKSIQISRMWRRCIFNTKPIQNDHDKFRWNWKIIFCEKRSKMANRWFHWITWVLNFIALKWFGNISKISLFFVAFCWWNHWLWSTSLCQVGERTYDAFLLPEQLRWPLQSHILSRRQAIWNSSPWWLAGSLQCSRYGANYRCKRPGKFTDWTSHTNLDELCKDGVKFKRIWLDWMPNWSLIFVIQKSKQSNRLAFERFEMDANITESHELSRHWQWTCVARRRPQCRSVQCLGPFISNWTTIESEKSILIAQSHLKNGNKSLTFVYSQSQRFVSSFLLTFQLRFMKNRQT